MKLRLNFACILGGVSYVFIIGEYVLTCKGIYFNLLAWLIKYIIDSFNFDSMKSQLLFFVQFFAQLYSFLIFFRIILSWIRTKPNTLTYFVSDVTDPFLNCCRKILPPIAMIDFSPILALFLVDFLAVIISKLIINFL